ncbi:hypothetical protein [Sphingobacterium griseoflavum]|uniref:3-oxoacyl-ACP synthase n=1 Tax=Sphingobacterium griseoflavum TaxID=1474952 RepID=A0ABQ3HPP9_9SPHI|nr:hypothetical protein [Sphingobacterium griseoflavum]GHE23211.1 hypothetical protein GCM10017764_01790 [Sphingobacterium griseoflavum]
MLEASTKVALLALCQEKNDMRLQEITQAIAQAQEAIESDTKSSAGDKYETSREMMQQDLNRYHQQLLQAKKDALILQRIELQPKPRVALGSLVITNSATYFIASSLGKQKVGDTEYMVISAFSPIGTLLIDHAPGDTVNFNGREQQIVAIF